MMKTILCISCLLILTGCNSTGNTKGQEVNKCMAKNSPEECDRQVNRRRSSY